MTKKYSTLVATGTLLSFFVSPLTTYASTQLSPTNMTPTLIPTTGVNNTLITPAVTNTEPMVTAYPTFIPTVGSMTTSTSVGTSTITQGVPAVGSLDDDSGTGTGGTTTGTTNTNVVRDDGFNWWWLLPLLAIPVLIYALRNRDNYSEPTTSIDNRQLSMGAKGGRARTQDSLTNRDTNEDDL